MLNGAQPKCILTAQSQTKKKLEENLLSETLFINHSINNTILAFCRFAAARSIHSLTERFISDKCTRAHTQKISIKQVCAS